MHANKLLVVYVLFIKVEVTGHQGPSPKSSRKSFRSSLKSLQASSSKSQVPRIANRVATLKSESVTQVPISVYFLVMTHACFFVVFRSV